MFAYCNNNVVNMIDIDGRIAVDIKGGLSVFAGTFWIPGIGEVVLGVTGLLVIGGIVYYGTSWLYKTAIDWIQKWGARQISAVKSSIPTKLKTPDGRVDISKFTGKGPLMPKGGRSLTGPLGYQIVKDIDKHSKKAWKLLDRAANRIASLRADGTIVGK
jgi:hypothetical protein